MNEFQPLNIATYYVIPLQVDDNKTTENCVFLEKIIKSNELPPWRVVGNKNLNSQNKRQGQGSDFICLVQPLDHELKEIIPLLDSDGKKVRKNATLFAGVAKTREVNKYLSTLFQAVPDADRKGRQTMVVPVASGTTRGLILVFHEAVGGSASRLIASTDPEIKNTPS